MGPKKSVDKGEKAIAIINIEKNPFKLTE